MMRNSSGATMKLKYVVYPGYVTSKTDGDRHYISASQLMMLYGVQQHECLVIDFDSNSEYQYKHRGNLAEKLKLIPLHPRYDGNYTLPIGDQP